MAWDFPGDPVDSNLPKQGAWVQSLVGELRSHMPCGVTKKLEFLKRERYTKVLGIQ